MKKIFYLVSCFMLFASCKDENATTGINPSDHSGGDVSVSITAGPKIRLTTDKACYAPGENVQFTAEGQIPARNKNPLPSIRGSDCRTGLYRKLMELGSSGTRLYRLYGRNLFVIKRYRNHLRNHCHRCFERLETFPQIRLCSGFWKKDR